MLQTKGLFPVYRLEEYGGLLQEGGVSLPILLLRARSYKTKSEGRHQGNAPILFKGWISVFVNPYNHGLCQPRTIFLNDNRDNNNNFSVVAVVSVVFQKLWFVF